MVSISFLLSQWGRAHIYVITMNEKKNDANHVENVMNMEDLSVCLSVPLLCVMYVTFYHFMFCFYQLISAILNIECNWDTVHIMHFKYIIKVNRNNLYIGIKNVRCTVRATWFVFCCFPFRLYLCVTNVLYPFSIISQKQNTENQIDVA